MEETLLGGTPFLPQDTPRQLWLPPPGDRATPAIPPLVAGPDVHRHDRVYESVSSNCPDPMRPPLDG